MQSDSFHCNETAYVDLSEVWNNVVSTFNIIRHSIASAKETTAYRRFLQTNFQFIRSVYVQISRDIYYMFLLDQQRAAEREARDYEKGHFNRPEQNSSFDVEFCNTQ